MEQAFSSVAFFYYTFSELFLGKDYYYLNQLSQNLLESDYSAQAINILRHIESKKLQEELEIAERSCLLERTYREVNLNQLSLSYEHFGYSLEEGYEPDHIGVELRLLSLLCVEGEIPRAYINQYRFIHNRLDWLRALEEELKERGLLALKDCVNLLRAFLRDHKAFLMQELRIKSEED